jgi:hypothetical protein
MLCLPTAPPVSHYLQHSPPPRAATRVVRRQRESRQRYGRKSSGVVPSLKFLDKCEVTAHGSLGTKKPALPLAQTFLYLAIQSRIGSEPSDSLSIGLGVSDRDQQRLSVFTQNPTIRRYITGNWHAPYRHGFDQG